MPPGGRQQASATAETRGEGVEGVEGRREKWAPGIREVVVTKHELFSRGTSAFYKRTLDWIGRQGKHKTVNDAL
ncbi:hypothetical protein BaRGS_00015914 [Batillaria attramentaria]|uniref:Uncharacterized protein n=1 Tax=Batillaria attramentaria TaxID=370345 RepID=A0ABD0KZU7_9CAEN